MEKKKITRCAPRISDRSADFYRRSFGNLNAGAEYILDAFPNLHALTLGGLRGKFSRKELMLMIDVMNGHAYNPMYAGSELGMNVADGMALDSLDKKWGISDPNALCKRISDLSRVERACLELWGRAFWAQESHDDNAESYVAELGDEP